MEQYSNYVILKLGRRNLTYLPLVYVLAGGKDYITYLEIFTKLKELQPRLNPKFIMVDFELAAVKAVKEVFMNVVVHGCFFHMCKCLYRQIQENGLQTIYGTDVTFAQNMRCLAALAFVPPCDVVKCYEELKQSDFFKEKLNGSSVVDVAVQNVLLYFEKTWIGYSVQNRYVMPLFAIVMWNMYQLTLDGFPRTNNAVEAWHNAIKILFGVHHPSIFKFIDGIKLEQDSVEITMSKMMCGIDTHNKPSKKQIALADRLLTVVKTYQSGDAAFSCNDFLFGVSSAIYFPSSNQ